MQDNFLRPASYWLHRADRCRMNGDFLRATVLERSACRAEPDNETAAERYAIALSQLDCYEASTREALAFLARHPEKRLLWGVVGQNIAALSESPAALDALNLYLTPPLPEFVPEWHERACQLADLLANNAPRRRMARHDGLLRIASQHIARGDHEGAKRALRRAERKPYHRPSHQRETLWASYWLTRHHAENAAEHMMKAIMLRPLNPRTHACAAGMLQVMGAKPIALAEMLQALRLSGSGRELLTVLMCTDQLNVPFLAKAKLQKLRARMPYRFPVLYNLCVSELKLGNLAGAARHIHLAREIDPDDVSGEILFSRVMEMQEQSLSKRQIQQAGREITWYGSPDGSHLEPAAQVLMREMDDGDDRFAQLLIQDGRLRAYLKYLLSMPLSWPAGMLDTVAQHLSREDCEALMREILLQQDTHPDAAREAARVLQEIGAEPPYVSWKSGRLTLADPARAAGETPAFLQRILTARIHRAWQLSGCDKTICLWAMEKVTRMTKAQRRLLIQNDGHVWPLALVIRYRCERGMEPVHLDADRLGRGRAWALTEALRVLRTVK